MAQRFPIPDNLNLCEGQLDKEFRAFRIDDGGFDFVRLHGGQVGGRAFERGRKHPIHGDDARRCQTLGKRDLDDQGQVALSHRRRAAIQMIFRALSNAVAALAFWRRGQTITASTDFELPMGRTITHTSAFPEWLQTH